MTCLEDKKYELIKRYIETFNQGPPIWKVPDERAIALMEAALKEGKPAQGDDDMLPEGVLS